MAACSAHRVEVNWAMGKSLPGPMSQLCKTQLSKIQHGPKGLPREAVHSKELENPLARV